ncbi:MAG: hypothetical protein H7829_14915 [Magnetococcus sp. THC-1_WYH]
MKKYTFILLSWLSFFYFFMSNVIASEREYADFGKKIISVKGNPFHIKRSGKLDDAIMLIKSVDKSDLSGFTEEKTHQEVVQFFNNLVLSYKFSQYDRPYIAYGVFTGNSWLGNSIYRLKISEIEKLNNRGFGRKDIDLAELDGNSIIPLKVLFDKIYVINADTLSIDDVSSRSLHSFVQSYRFGLGEGIIENSWFGVYDKNKNSVATGDNSPSPSGWKVTRSETTEFGNIAHYIVCTNGKIGVVIYVPNSNKFLAPHASPRNTLDEAAQFVCN